MKSALQMLNRVCTSATAVSNARSHYQRLLSSSSSALVKLDMADEHVAKITLSDPAHLNALTVDMGEEFKAIVESVKQKAAVGQVRAVVLTGEGKAFSAGGDIHWLLERSESDPVSNEATMLAFYARFLSIRSLPVPTIAAINGPAIGAGMGVAMACDSRIASPHAKVGFTFVGLGLHPGMGSTHFLPLVAGPAAAAKLLLSGRIVSGAVASGAEYGAIVDCVEDMKNSNQKSDAAVEQPTNQDVVAMAVARAREYAAAAPIAVQTAIATLRAKGDFGLQASLQREAAAQAICYASSDYREGVLAIIEKRKPVFTGA